MAQFGFHEPSPTYSSRPGCLWVGVCLGAALLGAFISPIGLRVRHPPKVYPEWLIVGGLGLGSIALALWLSAHRGMRWPARLGLGVAVVVALVPVSVPVFGYYESFHDMPWAVVILVAGVFLVGGWLSRQKWLTVLTVAAILFFAYEARLPPSGEGLPTTRTSRDLAVTIQAVKRSGKVVFVDFAVRARPGVPVESDYDLRRIRVEGRILQVLPVTGWSPHQWGPLEDIAPNEAHLSSYTFPPTWTRSLDYVITVPRWPDEPAASITVPVPPPGQSRTGASVTQEGDGINLTLDYLDCITSPTSSHKGPCLEMTVACEGTHLSRYGARGLRITGNRGQVLEFRSRSYSAGEGWSRDTSELCPVPPGLTSITMDAYAPQQWEENLHVFRFKRLPNPRPANPYQ